MRDRLKVFWRIDFQAQRLEAHEFECFGTLHLKSHLYFLSTDSLFLLRLLLFSIFEDKMFFLDLDFRAHCHHGANAAKVWIFMPPHLATKYYLAPIVGFHNGAICYPKYFTPCYLKYPAAAIMTKLKISTKGLDFCVLLSLKW